MIVPIRLNLHVVLNDEAKLFRFRLDACKNSSRTRPILGPEPTLIDLLEFLKGYQCRIMEEKVSKASPVHKPDPLGHDSFTRSKRQSNYLAEPAEEPAISQNPLNSQNSLKVPERFSFNTKSVFRSRSNMVEDSQEFFKPKLAVNLPRRTNLNLQMQSQTSQAIGEQEDSDDSDIDGPQEKKPVSAQKVPGRKLVFKKDQFSQAN